MKCFEVERIGPGEDERRTYGTFDTRDAAELVAMRAIHKHPDAIVSVCPVEVPRVSASARR